eukprot:1398246-Pleurochrysis_carterae.AAC.2
MDGRDGLQDARSMRIEDSCVHKEGPLDRRKDSNIDSCEVRQFIFQALHREGSCVHTEGPLLRTKDPRTY